MKRKMLTICLIVFMLITLLPACGLSAAEPKKENVTLIRGFPDASLTIFPVTMPITGPVDKNKHYRKFAKAFQRESRKKAGESSDTLGLLLEEKGFGNFEVTDTTFEFPVDKAARKNRAAAFGKFVSELDLKTDYALGVELTVHIERSWQEVYLVMVDANGDTVWEDSRKPDDSGFRDYSGGELGRLELSCSRLVPVMGLDKLPKKELAEEKKKALRELRSKEPPAPAEFDAMKKRLKTMKKAISSACVLVYPARVDGDHTDSACATRLSGLINEAELCQTTVVETGPVMEGAGWPNEMQVLWLFARAVKDYVQQNPADSDYILFADYWFAPSSEVWAVHFVVCDRTGDWVIVDMQNSHKEDFQRISPKNLADCDRLVLERFKADLR